VGSYLWVVKLITHIGRGEVGMRADLWRQERARRVRGEGGSLGQAWREKGGIGQEFFFYSK
jgi:hypothetical protein